MGTHQTQTRGFGLPGRTAAGLASASQLVESTTCVSLQTGMTAAPRKLLLASTAPDPAESYQIIDPLVAAAYPILERIWDNDDDALYDTV
jgi:hypothetical protein